MADNFRVQAGANDPDDDEPKTLNNNGEEGFVDANARFVIPADNANPAVTIQHRATLDIAGEISTSARNGHAVFVTRPGEDDAGVGASVTLRVGGAINTSGRGAYAINSRRDDFALTIEGGAITTTGRDAAGVLSAGNRFAFTMRGGSIEARGVGAEGVRLIGDRLTFNMSGGSITSRQSNAVFLRLLGRRNGADVEAEGRGYEHLIQIGEVARIISRGGDGIVIDGEGGSSRARLVIAGSIAVSAAGAAGVHITQGGDGAGGIVQFEISGTITATGAATTAIQNSGDLPLTIAVNNGARITGAVIMGTAADTITLTGNATISGDVNMGGGESIDSITLSNTAHITGTIDMGAGNDTLTLNGSAQITGNVNMGAGADTLDLNNSAQITGLIDMGAGNDTLTLEAASVISSTGAKRNTTVIDMGPGEDTVTLTARGNLTIGRIDGGTENDTINVTGLNLSASKNNPNQPAGSFDFAWIGFERVIGMGPARQVVQPPVAQGGQGGGQQQGAGLGRNVNLGRSAGLGNRPQDNQPVRLASYKIVSNLPGQPGYDSSKVTRVISIDPTGQAAEAHTMSGLGDALHSLGERRLGGGGSVRQRRAGRPIQLASNERIPGLLFRDSRPSAWAEAFGANQRRGQDGAAGAYALNYKGVAAGLEQDFRHARLGFLFGYARSMFRTRPNADVKTDSDSFFAGLYGRRTFDDISYLQGALNFSYNDHDNRRQVMGLGTIKGKYSSWAVSPALTLGSDLRLNNRFSLEPSVNLRYSAGFYGEYREKGRELPREGMFFKSRKQQSLLGRLNLVGIYQLPDEAGRVALNLGMSHRRNFASRLKGRVGDQAFNFKSAGSDKVNLAHAGLDVAVNVTEALSVNGRWEYATSVSGASDRSNRAQLSLLWEF